ncbi:MAG: 30S ribosome-binding factor RbfA [Anaerolineae bacterium]|nr:30S ribosome-binding factor RbfA [Anaerolineae bacterium]
MSKKYLGRAAEMIRVHLTELLQTRVNDPRIHMVTITGVKVTPDVTRAHVYFSTFGGPEEQAEALEGLRSAAGFLRRELGKRIRLRNTPELVFYLDDSLERGERISRLLDELLTDESGGPESEP